MPVSAKMEAVVICVYTGHQDPNVNAQQEWSFFLTRRLVHVSIRKSCIAKISQSDISFLQKYGNQRKCHTLLAL